MWYAFPVIMIFLGAHMVYTHHEKTKYLKLEQKFCHIIKRNAKKHHGVMLENCTIRDDREHAHLDAVLLTQKALYIFCLYTYEGTISGKINEPYWNVKVKSKYSKKDASNPKSIKFENPMIQNEKHRQTILNQLENIQHPPIIQVIVFSQNADIQSIQYDPSIIKTKAISTFIEKEEAQRSHTITLIEQLSIIKFLNIDIKDITLPTRSNTDSKTLITP